MGAAERFRELVARRRLARAVVEGARVVEFAPGCFRVEDGAGRVIGRFIKTDGRIVWSYTSRALLAPLEG